VLNDENIPETMGMTSDEYVEYLKNKYGQEKTYTEKELLEAEERAFNDGRIYSTYPANVGSDGKGKEPWTWSFLYRTFSDYKNSTKKP